MNGEERLDQNFYDQVAQVDSLESRQRWADQVLQSGEEQQPETTSPPPPPSGPARVAPSGSRPARSQPQQPQQSQQPDIGFSWRDRINSFIFGAPLEMGRLISRQQDIFFGRVVPDVARGVAIEGVPQLVGGIIDTPNQLMAFADLLVRQADAVGVPNVYFQLFNRRGDWEPRILSVEETQRQREAGTFQALRLPNLTQPGSAQTVTGELFRFLGNYATGVGIASRITSQLGMSRSLWTRFVNDFITGATLMDPQYQTRALELLPEGDLRNFLVEPDPQRANEFLERLKSGAIIGAGGLLAEGVIGAIRGLRAIYLAHATAPGAMAAGAARGAAAGATAGGPELSRRAFLGGVAAAAATRVMPRIAGVGAAREAEDLTIRAAVRRGTGQVAVGEHWESPRTLLGKLFGNRGVDPELLEQLTGAQRGFMVGGRFMTPEEAATYLRERGVDVDDLLDENGRLNWDRVQNRMERDVEEPNVTDPEGRISGEFNLNNIRGDSQVRIRYTREGDAHEITSIEGNPGQFEEALRRFRLTQQEIDYTVNPISPEVRATIPENVRRAIESGRGELRPSRDESRLVFEDLLGNERASFSLRTRVPGGDPLDLVVTEASGSPAHLREALDRYMEFFRVPISSGEFRMVPTDEVRAQLPGFRWPGEAAPPGHNLPPEQQPRLPGAAPEEPGAQQPGLPGATPEGEPTAAPPRQPGNVDRDWMLIDNPQAPRVTISQAAIEDAARFVSQGSLAGARSEPLARVNLETLQGPTEILQAVNEIASFTRERSVSSQVARQSTANNVGISIEDLASGRNGFGIPLDDHQIEAIGWVFRSAGDQLLSAARAYNQSGSTDDLIRAIRSFVAYRNIQQTIEGTASQANAIARAWQDFATNASGSREQIHEALQTFAGAQDMHEMILRIAQFSDPLQVGPVARAIGEATTRDQLVFAYQNMLLSSPASLAANTIGNVMSAVMHITDRYVAARIGQLRGVNPNSEEAVALGEGSAYLYGIFSATRNALRLATRTALTGEQTFGGPTVVESQSLFRVTEQRQAMWRDPRHGLDPDRPLLTVANVLGALLPTRMMGAIDDYFKWVMYQGELHAQTYREAVSRGLSGRELQEFMTTNLNNPSRSIDRLATERALTGTFNQPLGPWAQSFMTWVDNFNIPVAHTGVEIPVGRVLMPFVRTPANLIRWSYDHSPIAAMFPSSRIQAQLAAGGPQRDLAIGQMITGSVIAGSVAELVLGGHLTGSGPSDRELNRTWRAAGNEPYSIRIGDRMFSYRRLSPVGDLLGLTADAVDILQYATERQADQIVAAVVFAWASNFTNRSYFQGLGDMFDAMAEPTSEGARAIQRLVTSMSVPAGARAVERAMDPEIRQAYTVLDNIRSQVPGLSRDLPPQIDHLGRERRVPGAYFGIPGTGVEANPRWAGVLSPIAMRDVAPEPIDRFLWEHRVELPSRSRVHSFGVGGIEVQVEFTPQQQERFLRLAGNELKDPATGLGAREALNALVERRHPNTTLQATFNDATDDGKVDIVREVMQRYRSAARIAVRAEYPIELNEVINSGLRERARARQPQVQGGGQ